MARTLGRLAAMMLLTASLFGQEGNQIVDPFFEDSYAVPHIPPQPPWESTDGWRVRLKRSNPGLDYAADFKCLKNGICDSGPAGTGQLWQAVPGQGAGQYQFGCWYVHLTVSAVWRIYDDNGNLLWQPASAYHYGPGNAGLFVWKHTGFLVLDLPESSYYVVELTADLLIPPTSWDTGIKTTGWWFGRWDGDPAPNPTGDPPDPPPCTRNCDDEPPPPPPPPPRIR